MILKGKTAFVTGGTRGIGYGIVRKFVNEGANVVLCGSREQSATKALEKIKSELPDANVIAVWPDLSDHKQVTEAFNKAKEQFGKIDILANNAGITQSTPLDQYTTEEIDNILNINIKAVIVCSQVASEFMKETGGGSIINTSSIVSLYGQPSGCAYPASKFAVNGITKSLARELAKYQIRVNAVAPGVIRTDMVANLPDDMVAPLLSKIPLGRMGEAEDIANAYAFLASDYASYITGAILSVDGGAIL